MIKRKSLRTEKVKLLAIDELDDMLKESAKDQLYDVFIQLPKGKNSKNSFLFPRNFLIFYTTFFHFDIFRETQTSY